MIVAHLNLNISPWAQSTACMMTPCWLFVRNLQCTDVAIIVGGHGSLFGSYEKSSDSGSSGITSCTSNVYNVTTILVALFWKLDGPALQTYPDIAWHCFDHIRVLCFNKNTFNLHKWRRTLTPNSLCHLKHTVWGLLTWRQRHPACRLSWPWWICLEDPQT